MISNSFVLYLNSNIRIKMSNNTLVFTVLECVGGKVTKGRTLECMSGKMIVDPAEPLTSVDKSLLEP